MPFSVDRPVVFPLFGILPDGKCACGVDKCSRVGKHSKINWGTLAYGDPVPRPELGEGVGMKTGAAPLGSGVFVVDLDGEAAALAFDALGPCPETLTIRSPRTNGGWHLYFKHPGFRVKTCGGKLAPHVDIRGDGGIVVLPGSPHVNGGTYEIETDAPIADAPAWLLTWLQKQPASVEAQSYPGDVTEPVELERRRSLYTQYLRDDAPARGPALRGKGDQTLFEVVQRGAYDLALPVEDVLELVAEHYDPRCDPPWGDELEERVHHKARSAKESSTKPRAEPLPADVAHLAGGTNVQEDFMSEILGTSTHVPTSSEFSFDGEVWGGWDAPILPPVYLLEGLIPEGKVVTFFAEGGSLKSWAAFSLAISVATGEPWLGKTVKQGKAFILDYEDGRYEFQRRIRLLRGGTLDPLPDLGYLYGGPTIDNVDFWKKLAFKVHSEGIRLVVVDALNSGMPGNVDENDSSFSMGMKLAGKMTELGVTVVFIHHANKSGGMRGHSSIRDQSDVVFQFDAVSETDDTKRMRMVCQKPGPQKKPAPVNVELSDLGLATFTDEASDTARNVPTVDGLEQAIMLALMAGPRVAERLGSDLKKRNMDVRSALKRLEAEGKIVHLGKILGYGLDDDEARRKRVVEAARSFNGSKAGLALKAHVPGDVVAALLEARVIAPNGSGFIVKESGHGETVPETRV